MTASTPGQAELVNPGGDVLRCEHISKSTAR